MGIFFFHVAYTSPSHGYGFSVPVSPPLTPSPFSQALLLLPRSPHAITDPPVVPAVKTFVVLFPQCLFEILHPFLFISKTAQRSLSPFFFRRSVSVCGTHFGSCTCYLGRHPNNSQAFSFFFYTANIVICSRLP